MYLINRGIFFLLQHRAISYWVFRQLFNLATAPRTSRLKETLKETVQAWVTALHFTRAKHEISVHLPRHYFPEHTRFVADAKRLKPDRDVPEIRPQTHLLVSISRRITDGRIATTALAAAAGGNACFFFSSDSDKRMKMRSRDISVASEMTRTYTHTRVFVT